MPASVSVAVFVMMLVAYIGWWRAKVMLRRSEAELAVFVCRSRSVDTTMQDPLDDAIEKQHIAEFHDAGIYLPRECNDGYGILQRIARLSPELVKWVHETHEPYSMFHDECVMSITLKGSRRELGL